MEHGVTDVESGLSLDRLSDEPGPRHAAARAFCLDVIKEFYGFDYRRDWHLDLDSLTQPAIDDHYSARNRGAFWTLAEPNGRLVATAGVRALHWKPTLVAAFSVRYPAPDRVASLWRVYVRKDQRGLGLGRWLNGIAEGEAIRLGYTFMYLHASSDATATTSFWRSCGYAAFEEEDLTTHFDKELVPMAAHSGKMVRHGAGPTRIALSLPQGIDPMNEHVHTSHPEIIKRLKRAEGHLRRVTQMIETGRHCLDVVQQLHAVEQAIRNAKRTLIQDHLDHCLEDVVGALSREQRAPISEFKEIAKYL